MRAAVRRFEAALALHAGDLLPGVEAPWAHEHRERLRERRHRLELGLGEHLMALGHSRRAEEVARELLRRDPLHEGAQRLWMRALARHGAPSAVLRGYRAFAERLARELDVEPDPETVALVEELTGKPPPSGTRSA
jgi:DNA-binding SARP family transcriptional activator